MIFTTKYNNILVTVDYIITDKGHTFFNKVYIEDSNIDILPLLDGDFYNTIGGRIATEEIDE